MKYISKKGKNEHLQYFPVTCMNEIELKGTLVMIHLGTTN